MVGEMRKIKNEFMLKKWFENNFKKLGYSKIIRRDNGTFPDFIMLRNNKELRVELETLSSNFILHKHNKDNVDEIVCIKKDIEIGLPVIEIEGLDYIGKARISFTVDKKTANIIKNLLEDSNFRNMSHVVELAIIALAEKEGKLQNDK